MPQNTISTASHVRPYRVRGGGSPPIMWLQESTVVGTGGTSSNRIKYGDVVQFDVNVATANHRLVRSSTMAAAPTVLSTAFAGIAGNTPASTATDEAPGPTGGVQVYLATPATEFLFITSAAGTVHVSSLVGTRRNIGYDSTNNIFYANIGNTSGGDGNIVITEVIEPGTTNGFVVAKFVSSVARFAGIA